MQYLRWQAPEKPKFKKEDGKMGWLTDRLIEFENVIPELEPEEEIEEVEEDS